MKIYILVLILFAARFLAVHSDGRLHTCDLDLVSEEGKEYFKPLSAKFLNNKCADIFAKRGTNGATYNLYLAEANAFREFIIAIETYEAKKSGKKLCANNEYALDISERQKFYEQVNLCDCYKKNNQETFLHCLIEKRKELTTIINNAND
nr:uncharacterized protein LOC106621409 [Bactrocera oleae]